MFEYGASSESSSEVEELKQDTSQQDLQNDFMPGWEDGMMDSYMAEEAQRMAEAAMAEEAGALWENALPSQQ